MADSELYESEWAILKVVWDREPCTAPTVQEALKNKKAWAYTTVKTMMDRMVRKGLLKTERINNLYVYRSAVTKTQARRSEILRMAKRAFDGAFMPVMQFLIEKEEMSDDDYRQLEKLIRARRQKSASAKKRK